MLARPLLAIATVILLAEGSCCDPDARGGPPPSGTGAGQKVVDSGPCPDAATRQPPSEWCPEGRQIIARPPAGCVDLASEGWAHTELGSHCIYAHTGDGGTTGALDNATFRTLEHATPKRIPQALQSGAQRDCALLPSAPPSSQLANRSPLASEFAESLTSSEGIGGAPVHVAVIDTAPKARERARSLHGALMAMIIERMTAGAGIQIRTYAGLPRDRDGRANLDVGGFYGYQSDLAFALADALVDWRAETSASGPLIVNLSVGWDPAAPSANTSLVAEQLGRARCAGALIFAAVGNRHPRACTEGPTGPASLVNHPIPSECAAELKGPLVFPVSAVDHQGQPLDLSRANAPLAALGVDAVVQIGEEFYGPMSGSSVATALLSGLAARTWSNKPELRADEIVAHLYAGGIAKGTRVDASVGHGGWTEQRVVGLVDRAPTRIASEVTSSKVVDSSLGKQGECRDACGLDEVVHWPDDLDQLRATTSSAGVIPQPDDVVCPTCKIDKNKLVVSIASAYPSDAKDVRVTFWSNPRVTETIHFGPQPLPHEGEPEAPLGLASTQMCTVDRDGTVPRAAYVEFVFQDATGRYYAVGNAINVASGTPCP